MNIFGEFMVQIVIIFKDLLVGGRDLSEYERERERQREREREREGGRERERRSERAGKTPTLHFD